MDFRQIKAIEAKNKAKILSVCPTVPETSGIYILTREDNGFKYAYIGQAKHLLTRLAQHLNGYQHIDLSLKKHGLYGEQNQTGWKIEWMYYSIDKLDNAEQFFIKEYANMGYQLRNHTSGSQGEGKRGLGDQKAPKGYYDGLAQGYKNAQKFVANLFNKHLIYGKKSEKPNKLQDKAMEKFKDFLDWENSAE
jgi:hypothetical protein